MGNRFSLRAAPTTFPHGGNISSAAAAVTSSQTAGAVPPVFPCNRNSVLARTPDDDKIIIFFFFYRTNYIPNIYYSPVFKYFFFFNIICTPDLRPSVNRGSRDVVRSPSCVSQTGACRPASRFGDKEFLFFPSLYFQPFFHTDAYTTRKSSADTRNTNYYCNI